MNTIISSRLTFLYKYIVPSFFLVGLCFMFYMVLKFKIYPFLIFLIPFALFGIFQLNIAFRLQTVREIEKGLVIGISTKERIILWGEIEKIKRYALVFVLIILKNNQKKIYFLPKVDYVFSRNFNLIINLRKNILE